MSCQVKAAADCRVRRRDGPLDDHIFESGEFRIYLAGLHCLRYDLLRVDEVGLELAVLEHSRHLAVGPLERGLLGINGEFTVLHL